MTTTALRRRVCLALSLAGVTTAAFADPAAAASPPSRSNGCTQRAARGRRRPGCVPAARRGRAPHRPFGALDGLEYEIDDLQISGTMTARQPAGADWVFEALGTTRIAPGLRSEGNFLRQTHRDVGGRFLLHGSYVIAAAAPVEYKLTSSARYSNEGNAIDCSYNRPVQSDKLGLMIYPKRDRIAVRWILVSPGWACRHETTAYPDCGNDDGGDASLMFYKEIEFTRRWIKLPIDLQWRTRGTVECEFRWNGYVRLKKLRDGR